jgi:3-hydroxy-9,10-secoandrosta-1,3,5(10)-triene-9,17-dione monooxygenase reductase component
MSPEPGRRPAHEWPETVGSWVGEDDVDFELRPGDDVAVHDDPASLSQAGRFRDVLGRFASGVTVVASSDDGDPVGLTCQAFSSVSLEPPLVVFMPAKTSRSWPVIRRSGHFCVNVLAADQADVANTMASRGTDKFADVKWTPSPLTGSPMLEGALAHIDCVVHAVHDGGDHDVVIGRVVDLVTPDDPAAEQEPLVFYRGHYRTTDQD